MEMYEKVTKSELRNIDNEIEQLQELMNDLKLNGITEDQPLKNNNKEKRVKLNYKLEEERYNYSDLKAEKKTQKIIQPKNVTKELEQRCALWDQNKPDLKQYLNTEFLGLKIDNIFSQKGVRERLENFRGKVNKI